MEWQLVEKSLPMQPGMMVVDISGTFKLCKAFFQNASIMCFSEDFLGYSINHPSYGSKVIYSDLYSKGKGWILPPHFKTPTRWIYLPD
jgi:hypothetical protein